MDIQLKKRRNLKGKITRIENAVTAQGATPWDKRSVKGFLDQLDQLWTDLQTVHDDIGLLCDQQDFPAQQGEFDQTAARIEAVRLRFPNLEATAVHNSAEASAHQESTVRLPQLELPSFSGNLHDWTSFHDLFTVTINTNDKLSGAQKLQYLKSSLRGEASAILQSMQVTDDNFIEAWDILTKRYNNRREIINAHLKRLCSQQALVSEAPAALRKLIDVTSETVRALRVLKIPVEQWDVILVYLVADRLDPDSRRQWELTLTHTDTAKFEDLMEFLEQRVRALLSCESARHSKAATGGQDRRATLPKAAYHSGTSIEDCPICQEPHSFYNCGEFIQSSIEGRRQLVKDHSICFNCLSPKHQLKNCKSSACRKCGGRHHTLLHLASAPRPGSDYSDPTTTHHSQLRSKDGHVPQVLLPTALVRIQDRQGEFQLCRALLDSGSQATFISEACAQRLGLPKQNSSVSVNGIGASHVSVSQGAIDLNIRSSSCNNVNINVQALGIKRVTGVLPSVSYDRTGWKYVPSNKLADPEYNVPNAVDVLLGADVYADVVRHGIRRGPQGTPIAQRSAFGWLVSGRVDKGHKTVTGVRNRSEQLSQPEGPPASRLGFNVVEKRLSFPFLPATRKVRRPLDKVYRHPSELQEGIGVRDF